MFKWSYNHFSDVVYWRCQRVGLGAKVLGLGTSVLGDKHLPVGFRGRALVLV